MSGSEKHGHEGSVVEAEEGHLVRSRRVEDGDGILHLRVEVRQAVERDWVGQPRPSTIEVDQAPERAQPAEEASEVGEVPDRLHVVYPCVDEQDVDRSRPDGLVGEMDVSVPREPCLRTDPAWVGSLGLSHRPPFVCEELRVQDHGRRPLRQQSVTLQDGSGDVDGRGVGPAGMLAERSMEAGCSSRVSSP